MKLINKKIIENILYTEVIKNIQNHQKLVLAFSGGLDSTVLLDILYTISNQIKFKKYYIQTPFTLRAIYIHHKFNHHANQWAQHCLQECKKRKIPCNIIYTRYYNNNKKDNYRGIEATARQIRYQELFNNLYKHEILLTAQHLNDQSETFLLALKRGSGPTGLSGMIKKKITNINYYVHYYNVLKNKYNHTQIIKN